MDTLPRIPGHRLLHSPGPTHVPDEVLGAMHRQPMDLADPRVDATIDACEQGLRWLAGAPDAAVFMYSANGHGAWEAAIENLLPPGGTALVPGTGHFSDHWALQVQALGRHALRTPWLEGRPIDADAVEQALRRDTAGEIAAVFVVHTDTASGVTSDLDALRAAIDAAGHPALLVVDAVASLGAAPLAMQAQRIDALVGASQKGLMLPPGMGFVLAGARARAAAQANPGKRFYWDWAQRDGGHSYRRFCGTPPLNLLFGLHASLQLLQRGLARTDLGVVLAGPVGVVADHGHRRRLGRRHPPHRARALPGLDRRRAGPADRPCLPHRPPRRPERRDGARMPGWRRSHADLPGRSGRAGDVAGDRRAGPRRRHDLRAGSSARG